MVKTPARRNPGAALRIAFAGSHEISWHCLRVIADLCAEHGDELLAVFNHPSVTGSRHSAFVQFDGLAREYGFDHHEVRDLANPEVLAQLRELHLDVLFIIGWHRIVPQVVIDGARYCLGMHASLLPKNRGSSPINWSIIRREPVGGLTYFHLTAGVDSGDMIGQSEWSIGPRDTCRDVYDKATLAAADLLRANWRDLREGNLTRIPQDDAAATLNPRRRPSDGLIDWNFSALDIDALVRGLTHPYPGAFSELRGQKLFLWSTEVAADERTERPGLVTSVGDAIIVGAGGGGCIAIDRLQREGDPECSAAVFTSVYRLQPGEVFGARAPDAQTPARDADVAPASRERT